MGAFLYVMAFSQTVDVGSLLAGGHHTLRVDERVTLEPFEGWSFPAPAQVRLNVRLAYRLLEIVGTVDVEAQGQCDRCLGEVRRPMHLEVEECLEPPGALKDEPLGETNVLCGTRLDVADLARQLIDSSASFAVLCSPGCNGLCQYCGRNKNEGACTCA